MKMPRLESGSYTLEQILNWMDTSSTDVGVGIAGWEDTSVRALVVLALRKQAAGHSEESLAKIKAQIAEELVLAPGTIL